MYIYIEFNNKLKTKDMKQLTIDQLFDKVTYLLERYNQTLRHTYSVRYNNIMNIITKRLENGQL